MNNLIKYIKGIFNILLCCTIYVPLMGQLMPNIQQTERHLGIKDGLENRHVNTTFIDNKQQLWFLSDNRLSLFRGDKIVNYKLTDNFSNRGFNQGFADVKGNFWLTENFEWYYPFNFQGGLIFNPITQKTYSLASYLGGNLAIHSLLPFQEKVFIGTKNGQLFSFDVRQKRLQKLASFSNHVKLLYVGALGIVLVLEKNSQHDQSIIHLNHLGKILSISSAHDVFVRSVLEIDKQLFYVYRNDIHLALRQLEGTKEHLFPISKERYLSNILYVADKQQFIVNEATSITFYDKQFKQTLRIPCNYLVHDICHDNYGNLIASTNNGVNIIQLNKRKIFTFLQNLDPENIIDNYSCRAILKINNKEILVNTNKGRQLINLATAKITPLHNFKNAPDENMKFVLTSIKDEQRDIICGEDALVKTDLTKHKDNVLLKLDSTKIWAIQLYKQGYLLGLEKRGILYYDKQNRKVSPVANSQELFKNSIIYDFYQDKALVYIASEAGLHILKNGQILNEVHFPVDKPLQMTCFSLKRNKKQPSQLLIATQNGIWILDLLRQKLRPFIRSTNYHHKKFLSAYQTNNGVWASSEEGVWHFDNLGNLLKIYTISDGLTTGECNRLAHFQDENDILYFGGVNGINILNPSDFSTKKDPKFPLQIDSLVTFTNESRNRAFNHFKDNKLSLGRSENNVELLLSYEDYKYVCDKKYFYKTSHSLSNEWQALTNGKLILHNIDEGTTKLEIMVVSCNDFVGAKTLTLIIDRQKPIYLEWYFWVVVIAIIIALVKFYTYYYTAQLARRNALLKLKVEEQTAALQESLKLKEQLLSLLIHDVRYPVQSFHGISKKLNYLIQKNDFERLTLLGKETETKSKKVLWLIDELVYWIKGANKNWEPTKQACHLGEIIEQLFEVYSEELTEKGLSYEILGKNFISETDQSLLIIVLRNVIFNTVIHAIPHTKITITVTQQEGTSKITLQNQYDPQVKNHHQGLGVGLSILESILEKANFTIHTAPDISKQMYVCTVSF